MEEYKKQLYYYITKSWCNTIEDVEKAIIDNPSYTINRNEKGEIHSRYLDDRYEPAIIQKIHSSVILNYYLFDGDIRDCEHPFCIAYLGERINFVRYYSSERIINGLYISIDDNECRYNLYYSDPILKNYKAKRKYTNELKDFTELCEEMYEPIKFKFAD